MTKLTGLGLFSLLKHNNQLFVIMRTKVSSSILVIQSVFTFTFFSFFSVHVAIAQAPNFEWAASLTSFQELEVYAVEADLLGNVYTTGSFYGSVDLDPGASTYSLTSYGASDCFVLKLDPFGNFVWAVQIGGVGFDRSNDIAINALGEIHITGNFEDSVDFDPGIGVYSLLSHSEQNIFTLKLDSAGSMMWAISFEGGWYDAGYGIAVDDQNNVYTTGWFADTVDFDPGPATYNLVGPGWDEMFVCKLNSNGDFLWARGTEGTQYTEGYDIVVDDFGYLYSVGLFSQVVDFNPNSGGFPITTQGNNDIFINKLDTAGNFIWTVSIGGNGYDAAYGITTDDDGNVYTCGHFQDVVDFDPGSGVNIQTSDGGYDAYVNKLDSMGNFVWSASWGNAEHEYAFSLDLDYAGNPHTTGYYSGTVDFDPGPSSSTLNSAANGSTFISKLDSSGNYLWSGAVGAFITQSRGLSIDENDNLYIAGSYMGTGDFDPGSNTTLLTSDSLGGYVVKFIGNLSTNEINSENTLINVSIYPNPVEDELIIEHNLQGEVTAIIYALDGSLVYEGKSSKTEISIDSDELKSGVYMLFLVNDEKMKVARKFVKLAP